MWLGAFAIDDFNKFKLSDFRLLGPSTAADVLQLTNSLSTQAGPAHTRVVLSNNDLRIISRQEDDRILEELFQVCI